MKHLCSTAKNRKNIEKNYVAFCTCNPENNLRNLWMIPYSLTLLLEVK